MVILNSMSINMKRSVSFVEGYSVLSMDVTYVAVEVTISFACIAILVAACMILLVGVAGPGGAFGCVSLSQAAQMHCNGCNLFGTGVLVNGGIILMVVVPKISKKVYLKPLLCFYPKFCKDIIIKFE